MIAQVDNLWECPDVILWEKGGRFLQKHDV